MRRPRIEWRLPATCLVAVLVLGCGASVTPASPGSRMSLTPSATGTAAPDPTATPMVTADPPPSASPTPGDSPGPSVGAVVTSRPTPTSTGTPTPLARPTEWRAVPDQRVVRRTQFLDVVWTGSRFVAIGTSLDGRFAFLTSSDGKTWKRVSDGGSGSLPGSLAAGPGGLVAVGTINGRPASWTSTDGRVWRRHRSAFPPAPDGSRPDEDWVQVTDVVATGNGWLAVGRRDPACQVNCGLTPRRAYVWTSADGSRWVRVADQDAFEGGGMNAVAHGDAGFVAVGDASGHAAVWTSPDGLKWSRIADDPMFRY